MKKQFRDMSPREQKEFRQRQVMIEEAIELGSFRDRDELKAWMKTEFRIDLPVSQISTEYTLSEKQMRLFFIWLKYFTGKGQKPKYHRAKARITKGQLYRIAELEKELGWDAGDRARFTEHQLGRKKLVPSLFKNEATKLITGMERILAEQPFKQKEKSCH